jgi:hypothetical protein
LRFDSLPLAEGISGDRERFFFYWRRLEDHLLDLYPVLLDELVLPRRERVATLTVLQYLDSWHWLFLDETLEVR